MDTFDLAEIINNLRREGEQMLSLNVISLFANVPISETISYICEHICDNGTSLEIPLDELKQLLFVCIKSVQFEFNSEI